jgi:hypothetical protein
MKGEFTMRKMYTFVILICVVMLLPACAAFKQKKTLKEMKQPINCATADGDIRVLQSEKAHVAQQIVEGVTALFPAGAVLGILTGTEGTKLRVAVGEYDRAIDKRIAEIKKECEVE